jgi:voltage-dependent anion channel protein 2
MIFSSLGKVKAELKHDMCTLNSDVDLNMGGPMVNASAVIGHGGWLAGYQGRDSPIFKNYS